MNVLNKGITNYRAYIWILVLGLIGPVIGFSTVFAQSSLPSDLTNSLSLLSVTVWPTWWIGWFVLQCDSILCDVAIFAGSATLNVFIFTALIHTAFIFKRLGIRIAVFVLGYSALYGISFGIMTMFA